MVLMEKVKVILSRFSTESCASSMICYEMWQREIMAGLILSFVILKISVSFDNSLTNKRKYQYFMIYFDKLSILLNCQF